MEEKVSVEYQKALDTIEDLKAELEELRERNNLLSDALWEKRAQLDKYDELNRQAFQLVLRLSAKVAEYEETTKAGRLEL